MITATTRIERVGSGDDTDEVNAFLSLGWKLLHISALPLSTDDGREIQGYIAMFVGWQDHTRPPVYPKGCVLDVWRRIPEGATVVQVNGFPVAYDDGPTLVPGVPSE